MFGAIFFIGIIIAVIIHNIRNFGADYSARLNTFSNDTNTFIDHNGAFRDIDTWEYKRISYDENGDKWVEDEKGNKLNISQKKRNEEYNKYLKMIKNGNDISVIRTATYYEPGPTKENYGTILGKRYKDLETGCIMIVRCFNNKFFYVDKDESKVLRYTDHQRKLLRKINNAIKHDENIEKKDVEAFQKAIDKAIWDPNYKLGDPTRVGFHGNINSLYDSWEV